MIVNDPLVCSLVASPLRQYPIYPDVCYSRSESTHTYTIIALACFMRWFNPWTSGGASCFTQHLLAHVQHLVVARQM